MFVQNEIMNNKVYINKLSRFLPNKGVSNDQMEDYLGLINGVKSRAREIILKSNGIKNRYYALNKDKSSTHTNAEITLEAIKKLESQGVNLSELDLLAVGTTSPDQALPSHAAMVQGLMKNKAMEVITPQGSCNSGMSSLKYAYMSVATNNAKTAIAGGSEKLSSWMLSKNFEEESAKIMEIKKRPYIAFEREFLRWMLSDGAALAFLESEPNKEGLSLEINWIDIKSYAHELETCMYSGGVKEKDGSLTPWRNYTTQEISEKSIMALHQDARLLGNTIVEMGAKGIKRVSEEYNFSTEEVDYFLPHISSEFFREKIEKLASEVGCPLPQKKWFTNLTKFGNVGAASAFLMLEELFNEGNLKAGEKILIMSPESARFSYAYVMLTVV